MRLRNSLHFLTFVSVFLIILISLSWMKVWAAPSKEITPTPITMKPVGEKHKKINPEEVQTDSMPQELKDSLQISIPPRTQPFSHHPPITLADFSSTLWRFDMGYLQGTVRPDKLSTASAYLGLSRVDYKPDFTSRDWGGGLTTDNILLAYWNYRTYFWPESLHGAYYKTGFGAAYESSDGIANIINYQRYHLIGGLGLDDLWRSHNRYGIDLGLRLGLNGIAVTLQGSIAF